MFIHKIEEDLSLKLIDLKDGERVFELTNKSRDYLRNWLPWLDSTKSIEDTKKFINVCLNGFAEKKSMNTVILFKGEIVGVAGYNQTNWSNKTAYIGYWLGKETRNDNSNTTRTRLPA